MSAPSVTPLVLLGLWLLGLAGSVKMGGTGVRQGSVFAKAPFPYRLPIMNRSSSGSMENNRCFYTGKWLQENHWAGAGASCAACLYAACEGFAHN